jgi:hypothetical protein
MLLLSAARGCALQGITGMPVMVECDLARGLPSFDIVGLPDSTVRESRERVRAAIRNSGYEFVNGHLRIPFFGHEKSPRKGRRVYEQELCISSYLLYASLSWCMLRYGYSSFHSHRLRWLMPSPVVQGDGVFGNYHL